MVSKAVPNPSFWEGKRALVTGHTGFKGSWLSLCLASRGALVFGFALPPEERSLYRAAGVERVVHSCEGDLRDYGKVRRAIEESKPDVIFHMAAQSLVRPSYSDPISTFGTNVMGTVHLLEAVREHGERCIVVNVTSDKCYENREWLWGYREHEPMGGYDPYSCSKGCAELVTAAYRRSFFASENQAKRRVALASARAGNVIGGGDWAQDRLIPDCVRAIEAGEPITIRNPTAIRPWQHVLEPLWGYILLAEHLVAPSGSSYECAWNFGPSDDESWKVKTVVERVVELWGTGTGIRISEGPHPHEAVSLKLDCSQARLRLNWRPRLSMAEGLEWTVEWYRRCSEGQKPDMVTREQIERFFSL